jgi:hypothetical protein
MKITSTLSEKITSTLDEFVSNPEPFLIKFEEPLDLRKLASELSVLPMMLDMGGCYAIRPDGEIISFSWDEPFKLDIEKDARIQRLVLASGVKKYPELKNLLPTRPDEAIECSSCNGTGVDRFVAEHGLDPETIVCFCGGLGWLLEGEEINAILCES